jgi:hypothetical protein
MSVTGSREVSGRSLTQRLGDPPTAERKFIATLGSSSVSTQGIIKAIGITLGQTHPEYSFLKMTAATVTQGTPSPFHAEVTYQYELVNPDASDPNPLARPDIWTFSTGGAAVPALFYWDGQVQKPLVNSAKDVFEGLTTDEAECRATITANRVKFPLADAVAVTNTVNSSAYLGAPPHHWKCVGIGGQQQIEIVNNAEVRYWSITTELVYRQTGWNLQLPDVGWNYLELGSKKRAWVQDPDTGERVPAVNPQALNANGTLKAEGELPDILQRRVNRETSFSVFFGKPSFL